MDAGEYDKIFSDAKKRPLNFALLISKDGVVLAADPRKSLEMLRGQARKNGGSRGATGVMKVSGSLVELHVDSDDVPGNLPNLASKYFKSLGLIYRFEIHTPAAENGVDRAKRSAPAEVDQPQPEADTEVEPGADAPEAADEAEDDADILAAQEGDLNALMAALRKKPLNFAWLLGKDGLVLKAHLRRNTTALIIQAKAEGAGNRGVWGQMQLFGKSLLATCEEDPPKKFARLARIHLRDQGIKVKVVMRGPGGDFSDDEDAEVDETGDDAPRPAAADPKKIEALKALFAQSAQAGDRGKTEKIAAMMERLEPGSSAGLLASPPPGPGASNDDADGASAAPDIRPEKKSSGEAAPSPAGKAAGKPEAKAGKRLAIPKAVPVDRLMNNEDLSNHVDMWGKGMTLAEARAENANPEFRVQPLDFEVTQKHVDQGFVIVKFILADHTAASDDEIASADSAIGELPANQRDAINAHTDELFWKTTGYKPGEKLDPSDPNFEMMAESWKQLRAGVMAEGDRVNAIPDRLRNFLKFDENGIKVTPQDFDRLLKLADKLQFLSDTELADYWNRTNSKTDDVAAFATSVERYIEELRAQQDVTRERSEAQDQLVGLDDLYNAYRTSLTPRLPTHDGYTTDQEAVRINLETDAAKKALPDLLKKHGYKDLSAFKSDIARYENAFQAEAVSLAGEAMSHREHGLYQFEQEVLTDESVGAMFQALEGLTAKRGKLIGDYTELVAMKNARPKTDWAAVRKELRPAIEAAIAKDPGLQKLIELRKQEDPKFMLDDEMIDLLSTANSPADLKSQIMELLNARREGIAKTREVLADDPEKIWSLDIAVARTKAEGMVDDSSIQARILDKHQSDLTKWDFVKNLALGAVAIGAGLLSGGTGTVAVLGAATAVGIGAYEGWEAYRSYAEGEAAHLAGLSSTDPSFAWVVLALATIPLDALGVGQAIKATKLARGAKIAALLEKGEVVGDAVRSFNKAQDTLTDAGNTADIIAKLEADLAKADAKVRKAILRHAKAELEASAAFATALKSGGRVYAAIDPVITPIAIMASRFAYPVFLWARKGVIGLEQFLATRHAMALVGKLDDLKKVEGALENVKGAYKLAKESAEDVARAARELEMTDLDLDSAAAYWARHPEMSADDLVKKLPLFKQARNNLGPLEDLAETVSDAARLAYKQQLVDAERIANQCQRFDLSDLDVEAAMQFRAAHPKMSVDEFVDNIPLFKSDVGGATPIVGGAGTVQREAGTVSASAKPFNAVGAKGSKAAMKAPRSVMDAETEKLLKGLGPDNLDHDFAGTGGIESIVARPHPTDPTVVNYEIVGEILPGRLQRDPKIPLKPGQSYAPNFNSAGAGLQEPIGKLGFANPEEWQRLHLWGPGFGDEAAAGMLLGPREVNLDWQNSGVEDIIRELGRQVAPHRAGGFKLKLKAKAQNWGRPTPKGFQTANGEPLLKEASYEIILETPTGPKTARIDITMKTDPADINLGKDPGVHIGFSPDALDALFATLPK